MPNRGVNPDQELGNFLKLAIWSAETISTGWPRPLKEYVQRVIESDSILLESKESLQKHGSSLRATTRRIVDPNELWLYVPPERKRGLGQFFTPIPIVEHILDVCEQNSPVFRAGRALVADISCGSGVFLQRVAVRQLKKGNTSAKDALTRILGVDKDPLACALARLCLAFEVCKTVRPSGKYEDASEWPLPRIFCADSLDYSPTDLGSLTGHHPFNLDVFKRGIDVIVGNFPFLEAKKMNRYDPTLKTRLRSMFPMLEGAFDLYVPFFYQSMRLLRSGGILGVVLPNKVLVGRYATPLRKTILLLNQLVQVTDLSLVPDSFERTSVYPIVLFVRKGKSSQPAKAVTVRTLNELTRATPYVLDTELFRLAGPNLPIFCQHAEWFGLIRHLFHIANARLGQILDFKSTVSFHIKGKREQVIRPSTERPVDPNSHVYPYLGGRSYARRNEVDIFQVRWDGFTILYSPDLPDFAGHTMPPLEIFRQPKLIFCQHSQRIRTYFDHEGRFITKDVYPIALIKDNVDPVTAGWAAAALMNSSLLSLVYNTIYHGITINSRYYHYLPAFLKHIPVVTPDFEDQVELAKMAETLQEDTSLTNREKLSLFREIDRAVSRIHGVPEELHKKISSSVECIAPLPWKEQDRCADEI